MRLGPIFGSIRRVSVDHSKSWLIVGTDRGGLRAAVMYTLIGTAKLNDADPQAWLANVLERIAEHPISRLHQLLPWNWRPAAATLSRNTA